MGLAEDKRAKIIAEQAAREAAERAARVAADRADPSRPLRRKRTGSPSGFRWGPSRKRNESQ